MIERTLAKRYAAALLAVSDKEGTTEKTESLLLALRMYFLGRALLALAETEALAQGYGALRLSTYERSQPPVPRGLLPDGAQHSV